MSQQNKNALQKKAHDISSKSKAKARMATRWQRFRAFLIDIFMIYVPILYLSYFILGSKEAFLSSQSVIFVCSLSFGLIQGAFLALKAQSPGLRAYDLYLVQKCAKRGLNAALNSSENSNANLNSNENLKPNKNLNLNENSVQNSPQALKKASFLRICLRYALFLIGSALIFGLLMSFFRRDGRCFHDILSQTLIIQRSEHAKKENL